MSEFRLMWYMIPCFIGNSIGFFARNEQNKSGFMEFIGENYHKLANLFAFRMRCSMTRKRIMSITAPTRMPPFSPTQ